MSDDNKTRIAIAGFGFSGLMCLRHLAMQDDVGYDIHIYDEKRMWAKGLAYATRDPQHLLNVRASRMGAFADNPEDFLRWLKESSAKWQALHDEFADKEYDADSYVPRMIYGAYLDDILEATKEIARQNGHSLHFHDGRLRNITPDLRFITESEEGQADRIILAIGHYGARELPADAACKHHSGLLNQPWQPEEAKAFRLHFRSRAWDTQSHIVILGTGLSAVDMLHSLYRLGYPGKVTALSRHGELPELHGESQPVTPNMDALDRYPHTAKELYATLFEGTVEHGENWRGFIDGLRPHTNTIWAKLDDEEKQRFIDSCLHWWSIKRHRMSADSSQLVQDWQERGRLSLQSGILEHIHHDGERFELQLHEAKSLYADAVINASGYCYRLEQSRGGLIPRLHAQGMVDVPPLGIGIATDGHYRAGERLYALGPLLFGERLETTAIAELRKQAQELVQVLHKDVLATHASHYTVTTEPRCELS